MPDLEERLRASIVAALQAQGLTALVNDALLVEAAMSAVYEPVERPPAYAVEPAPEPAAVVVDPVAEVVANP